MKLAQVAVKFILILFGGVLLVAYQNCAQPKPAAHTDTSLIPADSDPLAPVNYFKESRPAIICGKEGYAFMLRNYIKEHCASCHTQNSFASPAFADTNLEVAYFASSLVSRQSFIDTSTHNQFCGPNCNLSKEGEVYKGLVEWLDNRNTCPTLTQ